MKKNTKYNYKDVKRTEEHGSRLYDVLGMRLPSVTTILSHTKDQTFLKKWKAKVGEANAEMIKNVSSNRGTAMHKFLEKHVEGVGYDDLTTLGREARTMAQKIIEDGLSKVSEYYGSEVSLYYQGLYAGSTDLVCMHDGMETIVDFKQSNRPKREEWVEDYYLQIAAYAMAHDHMFGSQIEQGVIMVCTPDLYYQEFKCQGDKMKHYRHEFLKRLSQFHDQNKA
jgi:ATP-dependent exoDNAse (exonuclease V) beta subunit